MVFFIASFKRFFEAGEKGKEMILRKNFIAAMEMTAF
jgi:hypothetical protein